MTTDSQENRDALAALREAVLNEIEAHVTLDGDLALAVTEAIEREAARLVLSELEAQSEIPLGTDARIAYWQKKT